MATQVNDNANDPLQLSHKGRGVTASGIMGMNGIFQERGKVNFHN